MKYFQFLLALSLFFCITLNSFGQYKKKKICEPIHVSFKHYKKQSLNLSLGAGYAKNGFDSKPTNGYYGLVGVNYFPIDHLEIGLRFKPTLLNSKESGNTNILETNFYTRYYPAFISCNKIAFFAGASIFRDGTSYSIKGDQINKDNFYPSFSVGVVKLISSRYKRLPNPAP